MSHTTKFALMILATLHAGADSPGSPKSVPDCGVASVYAIMTLVGYPQSLEQIESRFRELNPDVDLRRLSIADLRQCISSFGLYAVSLRIPRSAVASAPTPSILYLLPPDQGRRALRALPLGHFVALKRIDAGQAEILDLNPLAETQNFSVPLAALLESWDGVALVVSVEPLPKQPSLVNRFLNVALWGSVVVLVLLLLLLPVSRDSRWFNKFRSAREAS
jgi:ABC-type bacteriocin/lantibiotic exporter with double-glycine peptidase domain